MVTGITSEDFMATRKEIYQARTLEALEALKEGKMISLAITKELLQRIERASVGGISRSAWIRQAIIEKIERNPTQQQQR